jgi:hypothetical protein
MKSNIGIVSLVLVLMAASSLVSMFSVLRIDSIIHGDLYRFGLEFSYQWALPYWTMTTIIFAVGWFNIILSFAFQFYVLLYSRKETTVQETPKILEPTPPIEIAETAQKLDEQTPEKVEAPIEEQEEPMPSQESEQPAENVETTLEEFLQPQTETSVEATDGVVETHPEEERPSEIEPENPVEEQQPQESQPTEQQPTEQQPTIENQEPQPSTNEAEQQPIEEKTEDNQPVTEVPVEAEEQQPTQTTTSEDTNPQAPAESSQN